MKSKVNKHYEEVKKQAEIIRQREMGFTEAEIHYHINYQWTIIEEWENDKTNTN